jgi:hypothetical protein
MFHKITANDWGLKLGGLETTSLYSPTNLMKIPSLAERAKHLFTPMKVRRVNFRPPPSCKPVLAVRLFVF